MKFLHKIFPAAHLVISVLFIACALVLIFFAVTELWRAVVPEMDVAVRSRLNGVLDTIALLTIAVTALELSQTILEEEVQRDAQMSAPTRVRRFLSRFMIVLVVSLSIGALVAVFQFTHDAPENLPYAASIGIMAAALMAAWGVFVKLNRSAEELEPEAMKAAKEEDRKVDGAKVPPGKR